MINPQGIWLQPHTEDQFSHIVPKDSDACVSYSTVHVIESFIKTLTGQDIQFSERFLAKMSGTTLAGNKLSNVVQALKDYGLVLDSDWAEPVQFTWDEYYAPIPQEIIDKGKSTLAQYVEVGEVREVTDIQSALQETPLIIFTPSGTPTHAREVLSATEVFDSYPPYIESYPTNIYGVYQIQLTIKKPMLFKKTANINGEIGVFVSTDNPDQGLLELNTVFGTTLAKQPDNTIPTDITAHT